MSTQISIDRTTTSGSLRRALRVLINAKQPVMIWGAPGIGKSTIVSDLCAEMGGAMYDLRIAQLSPEDLRGMAYFNRDSNLMCWAPPIDLPTAEDAAKYPIVFLFLDEITSAPPSMQGICYQLILNRKVGTYSLPDNVVIVAAGNRETDRGISYKMPSPLANRLTHFTLRVDFDSWDDWAIQNRIHKHVVGFLNHSQSSLNDFDPKSSAKAFASPRTWEFVSKIMYTECDPVTLTDIISGTIGEGMALKFLAYCKNAAVLPDIRSVLNGSITKLESTDISLMFSLITDLNYTLKAELEKADSEKKKEEWFTSANNALTFVMANTGPEIKVIFMRNALQKFDLPFSPKKIAVFKEFMNQVGSLVTKSVQI